MRTITRHTTLPQGRRATAAWLGALVIATGCRGAGAKAIEPHPVTLRIGFGLAAGTSPEIGIQQVVRNIALKSLVQVDRDGRAIPALADRWSVSADGLAWQFHLRSSTFHDGTPADAAAIRGSLLKGLPQALGSAYEDIREVRAVDAETLRVILKRPSSFLLEALDVQIAKAGSPSVGTGPFMVTTSTADSAEMVANPGYYAGRPAIDRIVIVPYRSVRSAWADLLRGEVDMLYDVGVDALDSLEASRNVNVFTFQRGYAFLLLLNVRKAPLNDAAFRRALNNAIDRDALVTQVWSGHGAPADGPVWRQHWAYRADFPRFVYDPRTVAPAAHPQSFRCLVLDRSHERLALAVQRQLQAIGVNIELEFVPAEQGIVRLQQGEFDAVLADYRQGPNMVRPFLFWDATGPDNWGHYSNAAVGAALDTIRHAIDEDTYRHGVGLFQRAIVDDPPALFLSWRERARAVSTRFHVPADRTADPLSFLHLWRPAPALTVRVNGIPRS